MIDGGEYINIVSYGGGANSTALLVGLHQHRIPVDLILFADTGGEHPHTYAYYPICEVVALLHCGRQKAVNTLRELQYAGLVEIQKQGCGKPNRIYPKSYEAVSNTDFKKSGSGTPEG